MDETIMYEHELVAEALETLKALAAGEVILEVELALGPGVDPKRAQREWETATRHTPLGCAHVTWEQAFDLLRCGECGQEYVGDQLDVCPYCGADGVVIEPAEPISVGHWVVAAA